jgi:WD40 repeat protein
MVRSGILAVGVCAACMGELACLRAAEVPRQRTDFYGDPLPPGALARLGTVRLRHDEAVAGCSADGKVLRSVGQDGTILCWDVATGRQVERLQLALSKDDAEVRGQPILSPDGRVVGRLGKEDLVLYDAATGKVRLRFSLGSSAQRQFTFSADSQTVIALSGPKEGFDNVRTWDTATGRALASFKSAEPITEPGTVFPAVSSDRRLLAVLQWPRGNLQLWDITTGKRLGQADVDAWSLAFSADGKTLAVGELKGSVSLWDTPRLKKRAAFPVEPSPPTAMTFLANGRLLAATCNARIVIWEPGRGKELHQLRDPGVQGFAVSSDGKTLVSWGCQGNELHLWDLAEGKRLQERPGHGHWANAVAVAPDGKTVASGGLHSTTLDLWDATTGSPLRQLVLGDSTTTACGFSGDGSQVVAAGEGGVLQIWQTATGKQGRRFTLGRLVIDRSLGMEGCHLSADGKRLTGFAVDRMAVHLSPLRVWDTATGELVAQRSFPVNHREGLTPNGGSWARYDGHACFTPDGRAFTARTDRDLVFQDTATGWELARFTGNLGSPVAISPDGRLVAAAAYRPNDDPLGDYEVQAVVLAEAATGKEVLRLAGKKTNHLAFSADGRLLASTDAEGMCVWNTTTGGRLFHRPWPAEVRPQPPRMVAFSMALFPDGRAMVTGLRDGTLVVWDLEPATWPARPAAESPGRKELERLWADLAGDDAARAYRAIHTLSRTPAVVPFLRQVLRPAAAVDARRVRLLLGALDSAEFQTREAATKELAGLKEQIEPELQQALKAGPSAEARARINRILASPPPVPVGDALRTLRAVCVLERIGDADSRQILRRLAEGLPTARATRDARAALERLARLSVLLNHSKRGMGE